MNECENCGESVDSRWKFCLNCGARMPVHAVVPPTMPSVPAPAQLHQAQFQPAQLPQPQLQAQLQAAQPYREAPSFLADRSYAPEPDYDTRTENRSTPQNDYERAMDVDVDEQSARGHVGRRKFRFDWQLALGVVLALGGVAMIVYLVVVLIVPHN
ncbi:MAG: hypothetical protein JWN80_1871 [Microbacteriaceae bacterium]|jgi:hypothetical protein|nr:hypothetical protein [Microbacteriaceae bacterium]